MIPAPPPARYWSTIDDVQLLRQLEHLTHLPDPTGNWVGGGIPRTDLPYWQPLAKWSAIQGWYYLALAAVDQDIDTTLLRVLDLGCAGGSHTLQLRNLYGTVVGLDRSDECIRFARQHNRLERVRFELETWPPTYPQPLYDRIFSIETLEHFAPEARDHAILAALRSLDPGGKLLFSMPNTAPGITADHVGCLVDAEFDPWLASIAERGSATIRLRSWFQFDAPGDPCSLQWNPWAGPGSSHHAVILEIP